MYATSDVEDALAATREFLLPFEWATWWRLAVVAFFLSTGAGLNPPSVQTGFPPGVGDGTPFDPGAPAVPGIPVDPGAPVETLPPEVFLLVGLLVAFGIVVGLLFAAIGAIMEFVLVESLRKERVTIRQYATRRWRQGIRLFGFNVGVLVVTGLIVAGLTALGLLPLLVADSLALTAIALVVLVPAVFIVSILSAAAIGFTSAFVVPTMVVKETGVLDGWRQFWPVLKRNAQEYLGFALVYIALVLVLGVAAGIVVGIGAVLLTIPFGVLATIGVALLPTFGPLGYVLLFIAGTLWVLSLFVFFAFVQVPIVTFLRYYSLLLLGDTESTLDLIPDRRSEIRSV